MIMFKHFVLVYYRWELYRLLVCATVGSSILPLGCPNARQTWEIQRNTDPVTPGQTNTHRGIYKSTNTLKALRAKTGLGNTNSKSSHWQQPKNINLKHSKIKSSHNLIQIQLWEIRKKGIILVAPWSSIVDWSVFVECCLSSIFSSHSYVLSFWANCTYQLVCADFKKEAINCFYFQPSIPGCGSLVSLKKNCCWIFGMFSIFCHTSLVSFWANCSFHLSFVCVIQSATRPRGPLWANCIFLYLSIFCHPSLVSFWARCTFCTNQPVKPPTNPISALQLNCDNYKHKDTNLLSALQLYSDKYKHKDTNTISALQLYSDKYKYKYKNTISALQLYLDKYKHKDKKQ